MLRARQVGRRNSKPADTLTLDYEARYKRRIAMTSDQGLAFLLDLETVTDLQEGDDLLLDDGRHVRVKAAAEPLLRITADDSLHLMRIVWHIGNRHLPCALTAHQVLIRQDHVIADMVRGLGGHVEEVRAAFQPEGGAYGRGRTHSHEH